MKNEPEYTFAHAIKMLYEVTEQNIYLKIRVKVLEKELKKITKRLQKYEPEVQNYESGPMAWS